MRRRLAIIGGGPVGIEAALAFANGGQYSEIAVYERGSEYAANVKLWGHVRLFSPWEFNTSCHGAAVLAAAGVALPDGDAFPTGEEFRSGYLAHLWHYLGAHRACELCVNEAVIGIGRGLALKGDMGAATRGAQPFRVLSQRGSGRAAVEQIREFDAVIDTSGTYGNANAFGIGGLPAMGELGLRGDSHVVSIVPDILCDAGARKYGCGRTTAVLGAGHSAITTISNLRALARHQADEGGGGDAPPRANVNLVWATRRVDNLYQVIANDPLPQRVELNALGNSLCGANDPLDGTTCSSPGLSVRHVGGAQLSAMRRVPSSSEGGSRIELTFDVSSQSCSLADADAEAARSKQVVVLVDEVRVLLCTVTFYTNLAHSLTNIFDVGRFERWLPA
jgi:hypothetical protein